MHFRRHLKACLQDRGRRGLILSTVPLGSAHRSNKVVSNNNLSIFSISTKKEKRTSELYNMCASTSQDDVSSSPSSNPSTG